jgi:DNA mismatch repair protein MutL
MPRIAILDQNLINMIAAGEVIERPASVVKELMENSLDAGCHSIRVAVEQGGRRLISVTDDGAGMDAEDLALVFEPHATSKVRTHDDLHSIRSFGFRGEALASIAAVAQVRVVSRPRPSDQAHCIEVDCGSRGGVAPCSGDFGTTITVRDLFYRLPARQKFLRSVQTEMDHVTEQFIRIALGVFGQGPTGERPSVDLLLIHNTREVYRLAAGQDLLERVATLFPALAGRAGDGFIELQAGEKQIQMVGLLGKPSVSRANNKLQYVFLNGRYVRDRFISHAVAEAYRGLLEPDRHPSVFLFIQMPSEEFDVNVHPTKIEVRFYEPNKVHSQVLGIMRERLLAQDLSMPIKLAHPGAQGLPQTRPSSPARQAVTEAMADFFKRHRPGSQPPLIRESAPVYSPGRAPQTSTAPVPEEPSAGLVAPPPFIQIHDRYVVTGTEEGLAIIDQHALHEKILYERLVRGVHERGLESQRLLIPQTLALSDGQARLLQEHANLVSQLGLEITAFGPHTYAIHAFPTLLDQTEPAAFVQDLVDLLESHTDLEPQRLLEEILSMAACKAAIKAGQRLSEREIEQLLAEGRAAESAARCPHGRPTTISLSLADLAKQFLRT